MPDIGKLLWPKSVAVVGASSDMHGLRGRILEIILSHPFAGKIYPVSRSATRCAGLESLPVRRCPARAGRSGNPHRARAIHSGRTRALRPRRRQGRGQFSVPALPRSQAKPATHAGGHRRHRAALRHGGQRAEHRRLFQYRRRALPDFQPGDGQKRRPAHPAAPARHAARFR